MFSCTHLFILSIYLITFSHSPSEKEIPSIPQVQCMIEEAWKRGLDPQGASHFNQKLQGTRAWIGATEIYSLFTSLGIRWAILHCFSTSPQAASCSTNSPTDMTDMSKHFWLVFSFVIQHSRIEIEQSTICTVSKATLSCSKHVEVLKYQSSPAEREHVQERAWCSHCSKTPHTNFIFCV